MPRSVFVLTFLLALTASAFAASDELPTAPNATGWLAPTRHLSRAALLESAGIPIVETSRLEPTRSGAAGITGYRAVSEGAWIGMGGLASCVGLVVMWQAEGRTQAIVSHFSVEHDPKATLDQYEAKHGLFIPAGAVAYLAGGEDERQSRDLVQAVIDALKIRKASVKSYHPYSSLWVSDKGLLAYSFDRESIYATGYVSADGQAAMSERQKTEADKYKLALSRSRDNAQAMAQQLSD